MNKKSFALAVLLFISFTTFAQLNSAVDVQYYRFAIDLNDSNNIIKGEAQITIKILMNVNEVAIDLVQKKADGKGMIVTSVKSDGNIVSFSQDSQHVVINTPVKKDEQHVYTINYEGVPEDGLIISKNKFDHRTFFADNWPNRAHNWLPCNDHLADKAPVEFIITAPDHYQVVSNGLQVEETNLPNHEKLTHWKEDVPLPPKIMVIGVADFAVNYVGDVDCIPIYSWVYPENKDSGFSQYAIAKNILPWYIKNIGPYPYKKLADIQSKTIFGGMENANAIFYFEKSVGAKGLEALMAHEIAHQWFGNSASEADWRHLWLSEGFATYMTNLYHETKYGIDSFNKRMQEDRDLVIDFSKKKNMPVVDTMPIKNLMQLLNPNNYHKGGWVLHMLRRKIGDSLFWKGIRSYYASYAGHNASTEDLRDVFENVSHQDLQAFFKQWLYSPGQPKLDIEWNYDEAKKIVSIKVTQEQDNLFTFPLEIGFTNENKKITQTIYVKDKITETHFAVKNKPTAIIADPNVNLLFEGVIKEMKIKAD